MTSLTVFKSDDGIELVIDVATGEAFATQAGYSRMSGVGKSAIANRLNIYRPEEVKCWLPRRPEKMVTVNLDGNQYLLPIDIAHHLRLDY